MATTDSNSTVLDEFRRASFAELGFSEHQTTCLMDASYSVTVRGPRGVMKRYEVRVDHHYLRRLLDNGATHEQIVRILL